MKGTILDFLKLVAEKPELAKELADLAIRYGFEFSDEVSDEELEAVAGGGTIAAMQADKDAAQAEALIDIQRDATSSASEIYKASIALIQEQQQRQQENVQQIYRI